ncbi:ATP-binding protein [Dokdonella immobilis]|uniref:histidine kinase n=1 Tax=Dokdonella immobilis TaxID=578942 RepID=A0A1I4V1Y6_9GAMM|nr:ATP-binding protein [Dokdonella immobilis]SFM95155.1 PAS domain S-box-containing protein [Dokdonella immobilis]
MSPAPKTDPLYLAMVGLLTAVSLGAFALGWFVDVDWLDYRRGALVLSLVAALGLFLRARPVGRWVSMASGIAIVLACGLQLAWTVVRGAESAQQLSFAVTQSFASGMFCVGGALVLDALFPAQWGRHLLFGLLGSVAAMIGAAGIFAVIGGLSLDLDESLLGGMRLPGSAILLVAGLGLLIGARLRSDPFPDGNEPFFASEELRDRSGLAAALAVLLVTMGATLLVWRQVQEQNTRQLTLALDDSMRRLASALAVDLANAATLLDGVRGLFAASQHVDPDEWLQYFRQLSLFRGDQGIFLVGYAAPLENPPSATGSHGQAPLAARSIDAWPLDASGRMLPTVYAVPDGSAGRWAIGLNLQSIPVFAEAISRAETTMGPVVSGRAEFARYRDPESRTGVIVALALGGHGEPTARTSADQIGVSGFAYCALDIRQMVAEAQRESAAGLALRIVDDSPGPAGSALFESTEFDYATPFQSMTRTFGGRTWTISAQFMPDKHHVIGSRNPSVVLVGGFFAALVLFAVTWVLTGHRARALHLARRSNRELVRAQRAQQAVTDTAKAGIITADMAGNILYMNPSAAGQFGVDAQEMAGQSLECLMPERFRQAHKDGIERVASGGEARALGTALEMAGLRADGSEFPLEILLSAWTSENQIYFTAFLTDITDRHAAQLELTRRAQELERSNADLEQFAYVASHDLQEPLRMVASYVQLLARRYRGKLDSDADEFIGFAVDGATRMQNLIEDLLAYARVGRSGMKPVATPLRASAEAAVAQLQESISETAAVIRIDLDGGVMAVPGQLTQVFQNLIANALKFRGADAPHVTIDARREGPDWHVRVADNGIGIESRHCERVFAIFQRLHTRSEYSGTGIGLAICRRIIDSFGGRIWVESTPGKGSIFHFVLPQSGSQA